jgi:hypothetical protein
MPMKAARLDDVLKRNKKHVVLDLVMAAMLLVGLSTTALAVSGHVSKLAPTRPEPVCIAGAPELPPLGPVAVQ